MSRGQVGQGCPTKMEDFPFYSSVWCPMWWLPISVLAACLGVLVAPATGAAFTYPTYSGVVRRLQDLAQQYPGFVDVWSAQVRVCVVLRFLLPHSCTCAGLGLPLVGISPHVGDPKL
jgi:hypothetical protein